MSRTIDAACFSPNDLTRKANSSSVTRSDSSVIFLAKRKAARSGSVQPAKSAVSSDLSSESLSPARRPSATACALAYSEPLALAATHRIPARSLGSIGLLTRWAWSNCKNAAVVLGSSPASIRAHDGNGFPAPCSGRGSLAQASSLLKRGASPSAAKVVASEDENNVVTMIAPWRVVPIERCVNRMNVPLLTVRQEVVREDCDVTEFSSGARFIRVPTHLKSRKTVIAGLVLTT